MGVETSRHREPRFRENLKACVARWRELADCGPSGGTAEAKDTFDENGRDLAASVFGRQVRRAKQSAASCIGTITRGKKYGRTTRPPLGYLCRGAPTLRAEVGRRCIGTPNRDWSIPPGGQITDRPNGSANRRRIPRGYRNSFPGFAQRPPQPRFRSNNKPSQSPLLRVLGYGIGAMGPSEL